MKIKHIYLENFRTFIKFQIELGDYNVIIGQNNVGKSNLLHAISTFYNDNATIEDLTKDENGDPISDELIITLHYDKLSDDEKRELTSYLLKDGTVKVTYRGKIIDGKLTTEYRGFTQSFQYELPEDIDLEIKEMLFNKEANLSRANFQDNEELKPLLEKYCHTGRVNVTHVESMRDEYVSSNKKIAVKEVEVESQTKFQGFAKAKNPDRSGICIHVPAVGDPSSESLKYLVGDLIRPFLETKGIEDAQPEYEKFQTIMMKAREKEKKNLEKKINNEIITWNTTAEIQITPLPLNEVSLINLQLQFNDGVKTSLEKKGTGLQRYVFFKTLKILNEERYSTDKSFIFLFEEPEAHLHPQLQREIFEALRGISKNPNLEYQLLLTTHSPQFVDIENIDELFIFNKKDQHCTDMQKCKIHFSGKKEEVKTILAFNPNISEIFFANHIIIVEGHSEEITINYLKKNTDLDFSKTSVVNTHGKFNIDIYLKIINEVKIPYTVLIDEDSFDSTKFSGDKLKEKRRAYNKTEKIINLIDEKTGKAVIVSPSYEKHIGVGANAKSKPTRTYQLLIKNFEEKPDETYKNQITNLFKLLLEREPFNHKAINTDGSKWEKE